MYISLRVIHLHTSMLGEFLEDLVCRLLCFLELPGLVQIQQFLEQCCLLRGECTFGGDSSRRHIASNGLHKNQTEGKNVK